MHLCRRVTENNKKWCKFMLTVFIFCLFLRIFQRNTEKESDIKIFIRGCNCWKQIPPSENPIQETTSSCSREAWKYGGDQRVISYSMFGPDASGFYLESLHRILESAREIYPGWLVRIYSNEDLHASKGFCLILCNSPELLWCDVRDIPDLGDISTSFGMTWRFLPIGDPLVEMFLSRDLDSLITNREAECVNAWINSSKALHTMRDNVYHRAPFLGGMWGANTRKLGRNRALRLQNEFIQKGKESQKKGWDQNILLNVLYVDEFFRETLAHDSHLCFMFPWTECRPFPSPLRHSSQFVGAIYPANITKELQIANN